MGRPPRIYRHLEPDLWLSADYRKLSAPKPNGRTLFKYLLTSPRGCAIPGVVVAEWRVMASDLQWSDRAFAKVMAELVGWGMVEVDATVGMVVVTKALIADGHARDTNAPSTIKSVVTWIRALSRLPICSLRDAVAARLQQFFSLLGGQFPKAFADAMADSCTSLVACREPRQVPVVVHQGTGNREQGSSLSVPARDPAPPAPAPATTEPAGKPATFAPMLGLVALAVSLLNAARAEIDPSAPPLPSDPAGEHSLAGHLRALAEDRREAAIRHGVATLTAAVRAGERPFGDLRLGEFAGPKSWVRWQAASVDDFQPRAARGRAAPPGRAPPETRGVAAARDLVARLEAEEAAARQEQPP